MTQKTKKLLLCKLFSNFPNIEIADNFRNTEIYGLAIDSREVQKGFLFAALKGTALDGRKFIDNAIKSGASVVLYDGDESDFITQNNDICIIKTSDARQIFSHLCAKFSCLQPEVTAAITGTNGKTSTANFCRQLWDMLNIGCASIGTIGVETSLPDFKAHEYKVLTTPDPVKLHEILADLSEAGAKRLAFEASSHGLSQYRLDGVDVKIAAFTSFSRDHLDYHDTMEEYLAAKMRLFCDIMPTGGVAILNADLPEYPQILKSCGEKQHIIMSYGRFKQGQKNYIDIFDIIPTSDGQQVSFEIAGKVYNKNIPLIGEFQIYNMLCAVAIVAASGANVDDIVDCLENLKCVNGRMEKINLGDDRLVFIDYAHTPDALEQALLQLRKHTSQKLAVVFGCGGDRDKGKRPLMGKISNDLADLVFVTDDNPRSESPELIRDEILAACPKGENIPDRKFAIKKALEKMQKGDILLVAGKGHEQTQTIGNIVHKFCDKETIIEQYKWLK